MLKIRIAACFIALFTLFFSDEITAQELDYQPKILLVTAHPDDDALFSATVFKTTHLLNGVVDLAIMTNGEGGYKYSTLGNFIYNRELDREEIGRDYLPGIRKRELMNGGDIVGLRNYFFFDQVDDEFSTDINNALSSWDTDRIKQRLTNILEEEQYDFIFTMTPTEETHAHHKASAILALQAVQELEQEDRPAVLATDVVGLTNDTTSYEQLEGYPISKLMVNEAAMTFDRTQRFGHDDRLNYQIIANWVIAEHKSQGTMQLLMSRGEVEKYMPYAINTKNQVEKVRTYFDAVNEVPIYRNPDIKFADE